jgi:hypothetical protein
MMPPQSADRRKMQEPEDRIEVIGRKIGRGLAFLAVPLLLVWLGFTLGWW